ncbi:hypothetical protein [Psychrobacillus sp. L3]|uniref:hypothetical protein n=1 Tax=Psychrobacillus sp. L3 TaxID=3236891 RepID=UPI0036F2E222
MQEQLKQFAYPHISENEQENSKQLEKIHKLLMESKDPDEQGYWFFGSCELDFKGGNQSYLTEKSTYNEFVNGENIRLSLAYYNAKGVPARKTKSALKNYFGY